MPDLTLLMRMARHGCNRCGAMLRGNRNITPGTLAITPLLADSLIDDTDLEQNPFHHASKVFRYAAWSYNGGGVRYTGGVFLPMRLSTTKRF